MSTAETKYIESTAGVCGGRPRVAGTRVRVQDIYVWHEVAGRSAEEIVASYPQLSLGDVYAALTYFWDHRAEMEAQLKADEDLVEQLKREYPSILAQKLKPDSEGDPLSS
jgi:uncharacterized protein (DUF433 family)